jgi:hypothetical protein
VSRDTSDERAKATFLRGLTIGALLGAVLAGSSFLTRRQRSAAAARRRASPVPELESAPRSPDPGA